MRFDQLIVKADGSGAMALFNGEVVGVVLNGKRVDIDRRVPAKKVEETARMPRVRSTIVTTSTEPHYEPFVDAA